jgi:diacylglycerol kinase family enzyme
MRATLLYNAKSGTAASEERILGALTALGWKVERSICKAQLDDCLCHGADVIVVAGGDGTIARVAKRLAGTDIPMAIVPMGTANNVARSLGIGVDVDDALQGLAHAVERRIDLGMVQSERSSGRGYFLEGFGVGIFAHVVGQVASKKDKKLRRALNLIADELGDFTPRHVELEVDGRDLSGTYVLAAVMNAMSLGPTLGVAPRARCDDGELDVVVVPPEGKAALVAYLRRAAATDEGERETAVALPYLESSRAQHVRLRADGGWAHIDDSAVELAGYLTIDVAPGAVRLLAPTPTV